MERVNLRFINNRKGLGSTKVASAIELRITFQRKVKYISTGLKVCTNQWSGEQVVRHGDAFYYNEELAKMKVKVLRVIREMEDEGFVDIAAISERLKVVGTTITFWEYVERRAENKTGITESTRDRYYTFLKRIKEMKLFKAFSDINEKNIRMLTEQLTLEGKRQSTIHSYHKYVKEFINDAVVDGYLKENIYTTKRITISKGDENGIERYLDENEVNRIKKVKLPTDALIKVRDVFLFSCYTALSYGDLKDFKATNIIEQNGKKILYGKRVKTGVEYIVVIMDCAQKILDKYHGELPVISNQKMNEMLKVVALYAKVNKPITCHWARHTAGMMMLNNGVSMEIVSKVLGHSSIKVTQHTYARIRWNAVAESMADYERKMKTKSVKSML